MLSTSAFASGEIFSHTRDQVLGYKVPSAKARAVSFGRGSGIPVMIRYRGEDTVSSVRKDVNLKAAQGFQFGHEGVPQLAASRVRIPSRNALLAR